MNGAAPRTGTAAALLVLTPHLERHVTLMLANHAQWCRRNGAVMPPELSALLEHLTDNNGHSRPPRDDPPAPAQDVAVTYREAAARLGCASRTVQGYVADGRLQAVGKGRGRRIPVAELERFANAKGTAA